ncbi:Alpha/Beta hydrolase protein [Diplogelasinospora grovesii]|uniref:Alpha/Beta hydrolase protein n=1 Tax=Diplogelasinospora grovesii TaxID=303347 RepID=A0AAN6N356_9PEZI|nr:Alpha/Beta hydrolase protein [Diplogelasinospora grovesii]
MKLVSLVGLVYWALSSSVVLARQSSCSGSSSSIDDGPFPADLNGSNFTYPWPVKVYRFTSQNQELEMAFMDLPPRIGRPSCPPTASPKTAVLLHGKNFCGPTWWETATNLSAVGYRVIVPDQVGFCKSSKPDRYQFSLQQLALNTRGLLSALSIDPASTNVTVIGHSMGGMLAARFTLMYPETVSELAMVDPIGLEDWKALGVPYIAIDSSYVTEHASNYSSIRGYEQSTYYVGSWSPTYDVWVNMLVNIYQGSKGVQYAWNQALIVDMVLTQPVVYEFGLLKPHGGRTLLVVGDKDTTAIGKQWSPPAVQAKLGHYDVLGKQAAAVIPNCTLVEFPGLGHAPQIQDAKGFHAALLGWLSSN